jgi:hypothetical protein
VSYVIQNTNFYYLICSYKNILLNLSFNKYIYFLSNINFTSNYNSKISSFNKLFNLFFNTNFNIIKFIYNSKKVKTRVMNSLIYNSFKNIVKGSTIKLNFNKSFYQNVVFYKVYLSKKFMLKLMFIFLKYLGFFHNNNIFNTSLLYNFNSIYMFYYTDQYEFKINSF